MTSSLPARPDLDHLRREAKALLHAVRAADRAALARCAAHAPDLPASLSTAQLVVAREYGFGSWAALKSLVTTVTAGGVRYDRIGLGYSHHRRADPRIMAVVLDALGDARTVVNVGAGTGSYEPTDRPVIPVEPSLAMAAQRDPALAPAVLGRAESLPLAAGSVDAAMAMLTMHHWTDRRRGIAELVRVARRRIVLLTIDVTVESQMWLLKEYVPELLAQDAADFPSMTELGSALGPRIAVITVPVPADCVDGFALAFWSRPEAVLDPAARAATSGFARLDDRVEAAAVARLERDLASGEWDRRYGELRALPEYDAGLRVVVAELDG